MPLSLPVKYTRAPDERVHKLGLMLILGHVIGTDDDMVTDQTSRLINITTPFCPPGAC
jgi:hypothetical protein